MIRHMIVSILVGLALILSTFVSTMSIVQKIAYAQVRSGPSPINGIPASTVVGSNAEPGRNSVVQGVPGGGSSGTLNTDSQSIPIGPQETVGQGTHSIGTIQQNIQQAVQKIQMIAGASIVVAGVVLVGAFVHAVKQHQHPIQHHVIPSIPIPNIPNFHP